VEAAASSVEPVQVPEEDDEISRLPIYYPGISGCRSVEEFQCINKIEEGTYGVVYRGKEKRTGAYFVCHTLLTHIFQTK
jgi:hypothetical protein